MKKERIVNITVLVLCLCLYLFARWFRASYHGSGFDFLKYHFTDMLATMVVLSYGGFLLNCINRHSIRRIVQVLVLCMLCSFVWEYCAQFLYPSSTSDWLDVCSNFCGGILYWIIINITTNKEN